MSVDDSVSKGLADLRVEVAALNERFEGKFTLMTEKWETTNKALRDLITHLEEKGKRDAEDKKQRDVQLRSTRRWIIGTFLATASLVVSMILLIMKVG